jgi:hypothetical protein
MDNKWLIYIMVNKIVVFIMLRIDNGKKQWKMVHKLFS